MLQKETLCRNRDDGGRRRLLGRADLVLLEKKGGEDCVGKLRKDHGLRTWEKGLPLLEETFSSLKAKARNCVLYITAMREERAEGIYSECHKILVTGEECKGRDEVKMCSFLY